MGFLASIEDAGIQLRVPSWPWLCTAVLIIWIVRNIFANGLYRVPGPFLNSVSVIPRIVSVFKGSSQWEDLNLHKKYGKIVRVSPNSVSISDPAFLDQIYGISSKFYKSGFYEPVRFHDEEGLIPDPFVLPDKPTHTRMKRNAANAYSLQALVQLEPMVDNIIERLFRRLDQEHVAAAKSCDIGQYMHFFAMDTIFTVTFGSDLDFINLGDAKGFCKNLQDGLVYLACIGQIPWAHKFLMGNKYVARYLEGTGESMFTEMMDVAVTQRAVAEKEISNDDNGTTPTTFLVHLLRNQAKNPASITDREINTHTFGNIIAGGDTTSTALRAILTEVIRHPDVTERLLAELRSVGITSGAKPVPYAVASKLPYLTAVIKEGMRLHPSVGLMLARGVPAGGAVLNDNTTGRQYHIDGAAEIGVNPWIIQRDPEVFPDPEAFVPSRWLESSPEQLARMGRSWIPFGAGRHTCSGQHISMLEITKLIPSLVLRYSMAWEGGKPNISVVNYFFTIQSGLRVVIEKREKSGSLLQATDTAYMAVKAPMPSLVSVAA
ncbi:cytochrome P450 [Whalleya microplaca]|nr:cytochrome P450 [Whalleya microplaca]